MAKPRLARNGGAQLMPMDFRPYESIEEGGQGTVHYDRSVATEWR